MPIDLPQALAQARAARAAFEAAEAEVTLQREAGHMSAKTAALRLSNAAARRDAAASKAFAGFVERLKEGA